MAVKDTGIGMSKEETAKLFRRIRAHQERQDRNILGSGLGLSILRKLATLYGGDVTVASQPMSGRPSPFTCRRSRREMASRKGSTNARHSGIHR